MLRSPSLVLALLVTFGIGTGGAQIHKPVVGTPPAADKHDVEL